MDLLLTDLGDAAAARGKVLLGILWMEVVCDDMAGIIVGSRCARDEDVALDSGRQDAKETVVNVFSYEAAVGVMGRSAG